MTSSPKIHLDDVHARMSSAEINSIMELSQALTHFEKVEKYLASYLELGWQLKVVIPHLDIPLEVDFRQGREVWLQNLTDLALKGIQTSLMVFTGAASNVMVLGVRGHSSEKTLILGRDWRAGCVLQIDGDLEQHFYTWPGSLNLPNSQQLEDFGIMVFGEGDKIVLPPSLVPGTGESIRWLVAPWENPPGPPSPRLMKFLEGNSPQKDKNDECEPDIPSWEEILPLIASQDQLLQALLTPSADAAAYYQILIKEANAAGLQDQRLLLGLLWHAPLGTARHDITRLPWLQELITPQGQAEVSESLQIQRQLEDLLHKFSKMLTAVNKEKLSALQPGLQNFSPAPDVARQLSPGQNSWSTFPQNQAAAAVAAQNPGALPAMAAQMENPVLSFVPPTAYPHGEIPVNRNKYEALIYELGRLNALQKYNSNRLRDAKLLKARLDSQRQEEINHLRQLTLEKKPKKWW